MENRLDIYFRSPYNGSLMLLKERIVNAETERMLSNRKLDKPDNVWRISHLRTILTALASVRRKGCKNKKLTEYAQGKMASKIATGTWL